MRYFKHVAIGIGILAIPYMPLFHKEYDASYLIRNVRAVNGSYACDVSKTLSGPRTHCLDVDYYAVPPSLRPLQDGDLISGKISWKRSLLSMWLDKGDEMTTPKALEVEVLRSKVKT